MKPFHPQPSAPRQCCTSVYALDSKPSGHFDRRAATARAGSAEHLPQWFQARLTELGIIGASLEYCSMIASHSRRRLIGPYSVTSHGANEPLRGLPPTNELTGVDVAGELRGRR